MSVIKVKVLTVRVLIKGIRKMPSIAALAGLTLLVGSLQPVHADPLDGSLALRHSRTTVVNRFDVDIDPDEGEGDTYKLLFEGVDVALRLQRPLPSSWQGGPVNTLRWKFTYDDVDFDGLRLQTLGAGGEVLYRTRGPYAGSFGVGVGGLLGATRSRSFFDVGGHATFELSALATLSLGRVGLEYVLWARATTPGDLDEGDIAPRTRGQRINFTIRF